MATTKEKQDALRALVGEELADQVIEQAGSREKAAEESGVAFKAKGDRKTAPAKEPEKPELKKDEESDNTGDNEEDGSDELDALLAEIEAEGENEETPETEEEGENPEEEATETPEEEAGEESEEEAEPEKPAAKKPVSKKKEADDSDLDEAEKESPLFIGDILVDDFADVLAGGLAAALQPYFDQLTQVKESIKEMGAGLTSALKELKEQASTTAKEKNEAVEKAETALKSANDAAAEVAKLHESEIILAKALKDTQKRLKELDGSMTGAAREFVASQAQETVLKEGDPLRGSGPTADPAADFMKNFVFPQGN